MDTYDFASKHLYRARRESAIDRLASGNVHTRRVAYLDTGEALDTLAYLRRGYKPHNLWAINRNPAEVACLTKTIRAHGFPDVNTVGLDFEDALNRRVPDVDVLDFDGMGCISKDLLLMLKRILRNRKNSTLGFTLLGGRETKVLHTLIRMGVDEILNINKTSFGTEVIPTHVSRLRKTLGSIDGYMHILPDGKTLHHVCEVHFTRMLWDVYTSTSRQPMLWCVVAAEPHRSLSQAQVKKWRAKAGKLLPCPRCLLGDESMHDVILNMKDDFTRLGYSMKNEQAASMMAEAIAFGQNEKYAHKLSK